MTRIAIFGNSGAGKLTLARRLSVEHGVPHLDLDQLAWSSPGVRRPIDDSAAAIEQYVAQHGGWIAEGCYADLLEMIVPHATEIIFLNPGVDACVAHCRARPWEPAKYASREEQDARLEFLIAWVCEYETRRDEYSLQRHRALFDEFAGRKREVRAVSS